MRRIEKTGSFRIESLDNHDRQDFVSGQASLDRYFREQATQDIKRLMASCFVAVDPATNGVSGFYTLAATSVVARELPPETIKRLPRYPTLPAALIGRLAIDHRFQGRGLGGALLADAALRVLGSDIKAFALIVDTIDENATAFYRHHGFRAFASRPMSLFLPLATVRKAATKAGEFGQSSRKKKPCLATSVTHG